MTYAEALREAAYALEHDAEFNMTIVDWWSAEKRDANNRLIIRSREWHARADAAEKAERVA